MGSRFVRLSRRFHHLRVRASSMGGADRPLWGDLHLPYLSDSRRALQMQMNQAIEDVSGSREIIIDMLDTTPIMFEGSLKIGARSRLLRETSQLLSVPRQVRSWRISGNRRLKIVTQALLGEFSSPRMFPGPSIELLRNGTSI